MRRWAWLVLLGLALVGVSATSARAQDPSNPQLHEGFWFSGGLGFGSLGCRDCSGRETGGVGMLAIGGTISQRLLLGASTTGWSKSQYGTTLSAGTLGATLRFYPSGTSGFFLRADLGVGSIDVSAQGFGHASQTTTSAVVGAGWDFRIARMVSLTPFINAVGLSWSGGDANYTQLGLAVTTH